MIEYFVHSFAALRVTHVAVTLQTWLAFLLFVALAVKGRDFQTLARIAPNALLNPVQLGRDLHRSTVLSNCTAESCGGRRNPELYNKVSLLCV